MDLTPDFYADWFKWAEARGPQLAKENPLLVLEFADDLSKVVKADVDLFTSLGKVLHGGVFGIAIGVGQWVSAHADPLKPQREALRAMRAKYGEVTSAK